MSTFDLAIDFVLNNEGGFEDNEKDPGGATNFGISQRFLDTIDYPIRIVKDLTQDDAKNIYLKYFWSKYRLSYITSQHLATKYFDMMVNMGIDRATIILQEACNELRESRLKYLEESFPKPLQLDGIPGMETFRLCNAMPEMLIIVNLRQKSIQYYEAIVKSRPQDEEFLQGWLRRAAL